MAGITSGSGSVRALAELDRQKTRDYVKGPRMAERAKKESELGRKLTGPKPSRPDTGAACQAAPGEHD